MAIAAVQGISDFSGVLTFVAPTGGVTVNKTVKIGGVVVIPMETAAAAASFQGYVAASCADKIFKGTKVAGVAWTVGAVIYWDSTNGFNTTGTGDTGGFIAAIAAASADTVGWVLPIGS